MTFVDKVADGTVFGGKAFSNQPELRVIDKGSNVLSGDSASTVTATILDNPSDGSLTPVGNTVVSLKKGVATFNNLAINYVGLSYKLKYSLSGSNVAVVGGKIVLL